MKTPPLKVHSNKGRLFVYTLATGAIFAGGFFGLQYFPGFLPSLTTYKSQFIAQGSGLSPKAEKVMHLKTPEPLKAIYMSQCVVGTKDFRQDLVDLIKRTELNAVVIDIKDYTGKIAFETDNPKLKNSVSGDCGATDMKNFILSLHDDGIYVIGRVTVFQDPYMTKTRPDLAVKKKSDNDIVWKDYKGLSFVDVGAREHWDYIIEIAKEAYGIGYDEINFDYIRFPSDGDMKDIDYTYSRGKTKAEVLREFFSYLHDNLKSLGVIVSADLFGMTTTNTDDLNIGQILEYGLMYFDYVSPMVYPSHYPPNFNNWKNPNLYPGEVVSFSMGKAVERALATSTTLNLINSIPIASTTPQLYTKPVWDKLKLRPWLQDFQYGGTYGPKEVRAQIDATYSVGLTSWMLWAPSNRYTESALLK
ncbi:MAG: putative glycoside hydrolase [Patescibacteria group bacterium]